jgi:hypothetical protein
MTLVTSVQAYTTGIASVDQFRANSVDIYELITINYTTIGTEGSSIAVIRSDGQLMQDVQARAAGELGSNERIELLPEVRSVWSQTAMNLMALPFGTYNPANTTYWVQRSFTNKTIAYLNVTTTFNNASMIATNAYSGYRFQATLLPAYDVAYDWCTTNGAILNSVDEINLTTTMNSKIVDFLVVEMSEEMEPDLNLNDGYQAIPVSAGFAWGELAKFIIKIVLLILAAVTIIVTAPSWANWFDFSTYNDYHPDQSIDINWTVPGLNESALWEQYLDHCAVLNQTPTMEGYTEWIKVIYGQATPKISVNPGWNNNFTTTPGDKPDNILTSIIAFLSDLGPLIMAIIIIVAFIFGFMLIYKGYKRMSDWISPKDA